MSLHTLPNELLADVLCLVSRIDLVQLARTCQRLRDVIEPLLWTDIEFHEAGYHESKAELKDPPPFVSPSQRRYPDPSKCTVARQARASMAEAFFNLLQYYQVKDEARLRALASRVRSLCTVVEPEWRPHRRSERAQAEQCPQVWTLLPYFVNLEVLELHGNSVYSSQFEEEESYTLDSIHRLRFVKLFGYVPRTVASWAILSGSNLERLELGMLDRPISTNFQENREFAPLASDKIGNDSEDDESDYGSLDGDLVIPRPLGRFLGGRSHAEISLPRLQHLYLCQPCDGDYIGGAEEYSWSSRAAEETLDDWFKLLTAAGKTLETLVLEQRVAAEYVENDTFTEEEFVAEKVDPIASKHLFGRLNPMIDEGAFPALKRAYLYGIAVGETAAGAPTVNAPGGRFMLSLKQHNIKCQAMFGTWCCFDRDSGSTPWAQWNWEEEEIPSEFDVRPPEFEWNTVLASV